MRSPLPFGGIGYGQADQIIFGVAPHLRSIDASRGVLVRQTFLIVAAVSGVVALACVWLMDGPKRVFVRTVAPPAEKATLYFNGVRLDPDNVFMVPWPSNRFEFRASVESRVLANYSNVWLSVGLSTHLTNLFTTRSLIRWVRIAAALLRGA